MTLTTSSLLKMIEKSINFIEMSLVKSEYFNKQTLNIVLKMGEVIQIQKPKQPVYTEDAWDNIHGDVINFG